jgi:glycerol-3-phosphate cytidylyltransferase
MNILIIGSGLMGTAIGHCLALNSNNNVHLLVRTEKVSNEINERHTNLRYFPDKNLNPRLKATTDYEEIKRADIIFIALPIHVIYEHIDNIKKYFLQNALVVNLSKGIYSNGITVVESLQKQLNNMNIVSLKGGTFAVEMINGSPLLFTLGFKRKHQYVLVNKAIKNTNIFIDYTTDIRGVELLSALKNIYATLIGNIDTTHYSPNTRFMILTKVFSEIRIIMKALGGRGDTMFLSAGVGDIALTLLNDLSKSKISESLIYRGFYSIKNDNSPIVIEEIEIIDFLDITLSSLLKKRLPLFKTLITFLKERKNKIDFVFQKLMKNDYRTVLIYGTFDLLHYGHVEVLRQAKQLGDKLIVGLSTDEFNLKKGKKCEILYDKRKQLLESVDYVDLVIPENNWEQKIEDIRQNDVDIFVMGDDWRGKFDFLEKYCKVHYIKRTTGISTTKLKSILESSL